jgi:hypothetical protein
VARLEQAENERNGGESPNEITNSAIITSASTTVLTTLILARLLLT